MNVLKWLGNKGPLAPTILEQLGPVERWTRYVEPFAGSLAILLHARAAGYDGDVVVAEKHPMIRAFLGGMAEDPESIADVLATMPRMYITSQTYERIRAEFNRRQPRKTDWRFGAMFIWLNRAGFNGLFRTNRLGKFNVAWGEKRVLTLPTTAEVEAFGRAILYADVKPDWKEARAAGKLAGARVYCDPPYVGTHSYGGKWTREDRQALAKWAGQVVKAGGRIVISEIDTEDAREDFAGLEFVPTRTVYQSVSVNPAKRGVRREALWVGGAL
jgi:DNA adenine methylase